MYSLVTKSVQSMSRQGAVILPARKTSALRQTEYRLFYPLSCFLLDCVTTLSVDTRWIIYDLFLF